MLTYTGARNLYGSLTNITSSTNLSLGDTLINEGQRIMLADIPWPFLEAQGTATTVAGTQFYSLSGNLEKVISCKVSVGTFQYIPTQVVSFSDWDLVNNPTGVQSDNPSYFFVYGNTLGLWPTPATSSNTITYNFERAVKDLSVADYTTGTIVTATNGSASITGSGTSWNAGMVGKFLRITADNAANKGDGIWYEIATVPSTTTLTLQRPYAGVSIAAGAAAYTIGDCMVIPERYQIAPVYYAVAEYWKRLGDLEKSDRYQDLFRKTLDVMREAEGHKTTDVVIDDGSDFNIINPNLNKQAVGP